MLYSVTFYSTPVEKFTQKSTDSLMDYHDHMTLMTVSLNLFVNIERHNEACTRSIYNAMKC